MLSFLYKLISPQSNSSENVSKCYDIAEVYAKRQNDDEKSDATCTLSQFPVFVPTSLVTEPKSQDQEQEVCCLCQVYESSASLKPCAHSFCTTCFTEVLKDFGESLHAQDTNSAENSNRQHIQCPICCVSIDQFVRRGVEEDDALTNQPVSSDLETRDAPRSILDTLVSAEPQTDENDQPSSESCDSCTPSDIENNVIPGLSQAKAQLIVTIPVQLDEVDTLTSTLEKSLSINTETENLNEAVSSSPISFCIDQAQTTLSLLSGSVSDTPLQIKIPVMDNSMMITEKGHFRKKNRSMSPYHLKNMISMTPSHVRVHSADIRNPARD